MAQNKAKELRKQLSDCGFKTVPVGFSKNDVALYIYNLREKVQRLEKKLEGTTNITEEMVEQRLNTQKAALEAGFDRDLDEANEKARQLLNAEKAESGRLADEMKQLTERLDAKEAELQRMTKLAKVSQAYPDRPLDEAVIADAEKKAEQIIENARDKADDMARRADEFASEITELLSTAGKRLASGRAMAVRKKPKGYAPIESFEGLDDLIPAETAKAESPATNDFNEFDEFSELIEAPKADNKQYIAAADEDFAELLTTSGGGEETVDDEAFMMGVTPQALNQNRGTKLGDGIIEEINPTVIERGEDLAAENPLNKDYGENLGSEILDIATGDEEEIGEEAEFAFDPERVSLLSINHTAEVETEKETDEELDELLLGNAEDKSKILKMPTSAPTRDTNNYKKNKKKNKAKKLAGELSDSAV